MIYSTTMHVDLCICIFYVSLSLYRVLDQHLFMIMENPHAFTKNVTTLSRLYSTSDHLFCKTPCIKNWTWTCSIFFLLDMTWRNLAGKSKGSSYSGYYWAQPNAPEGFDGWNTGGTMLVFLETYVFPCFSYEILPDDLPVWDKKAHCGML